jgi:hypothetical protein
MSVNQKFAEQIMALTRKGAEQAEAIRSLGYEAVKRAYNSNHEYAQFMMDNLTQIQRKPLYAWFKRAGLNIVSPVVGSARYIVSGIVDAKRQEKAFTFAQNTPVFDLEHAIVKEKVIKPLTGTAFSRATNAVASKIKSMRETDPDGATALNELAQVPMMGLYLENGERVALSHDELRSALDAVALMRLEAGYAVEAIRQADIDAVVESRKPQSFEIEHNPAFLDAMASFNLAVA